MNLHRHLQSCVHSYLNYSVYCYTHFERYRKFEAFKTCSCEVYLKAKGRSFRSKLVNLQINNKINITTRNRVVNEIVHLTS